VSRRIPVLVVIALLAGLAGCELVVDDGTRVLATTDAEADATDPDAAPPDASTVEVTPPIDSGALDVARADVGPGPDCSSTCLGEATACKQTCSSTQMTCMSACHGGGPQCQNQCTQADMSCTGACNAQCFSCFMQAACGGQTACSL
jgi:hypothetical protein